MSIEDFLKEYNLMPWTLEDCAIIAADVDDKDFRTKAKNYLVAMETFMDKLDEIGYELG